MPPSTESQSTGPQKRKRERENLLWDILISTFGGAGSLSTLITAATTGSTNAFLWACGAAFTLLTPIAMIRRRRYEGKMFPHSRIVINVATAAAIAALPATGIYELLPNPPSDCTADGTVQSAGGNPSSLAKVSLSAKVYMCPTTGYAQVYLDPAPQQVIGIMGHEQTMWVVCWAPGRNPGVWYYTEADHGAGPTKRTLLGWGYLPGNDLTTAVRPDPNVPACHFPAG